MDNLNNQNPQENGAQNIENAFGNMPPIPQAPVQPQAYEPIPQAPVQPQAYEPIPQAPVQPQGYNPAPQQPGMPGMYAPVAQAPVGGVPPKKKSNLPIIIGAVVAIIAVIVAAVLAITLRDRDTDADKNEDKVKTEEKVDSEAYKDALEIVMECNVNFDTEHIEELLPDSVWEYLGEQEAKDKEELIDDWIEAFEEAKEQRDEYPFIMEYAGLSSHEIFEDDIEDIRESLEYEYELDHDTVGDKAYVADVKLELFEDGESVYEETGEYYIINVDGEWYVIDDYYSFFEID